MPENDTIAEAENISLRVEANFYGKVYFEKPVSKKDFYSFNADGGTVYCKATALPGTVDKYNVGMRNVDTNQDMGWYANIDKNTVMRMGETKSGIRYGLRVSSYDKAGYGVMEVWQ